MRTRISTSFSAAEIAAMKEVLELINGDRRSTNVPRQMKQRLLRRMNKLHAQLSLDPVSRPRKRVTQSDADESVPPEEPSDSETLTTSRW